MVSATCAEWFIAPDVPVTITVTGVPVVLELDPQPAMNIRPTASRQITLAPSTSFHLFDNALRFRLRAAKTMPSGASPEMGNQPVIPAITYPPGGATDDTESIIMELARLDPGLIVAGEKEQVTPVGATQLKAMAPLNPPLPVALTESVVDCPIAKLKLCDARINEKSPVVTALAGISVANKPLLSVGPPVVK